MKTCGRGVRKIIFPVTLVAFRASPYFITTSPPTCAGQGYNDAKNIMNTKLRHSYVTRREIQAFRQPRIHSPP